MKKVCVSCRTTGRFGAGFVLWMGGKPNPVHKHCGEQMVANAPKGVECKLNISQELRNQFQARKAWDRLRQPVSTA